MKHYVFFALLSLTLTLSGCAASREDASPPQVRVMLTAADGLTVSGENPRLIPAGESTAFTVTAADGWHILSASMGEYDAKTGILTLPDVRYPTTVTFQTAHDSQRVKFFADPADSGGGTASDIHQGYVFTGTEATVTATPKKGYKFIGWTAGRTLAKGGEIISREAVYTHTVTENTFLYANFAAAVTDDMMTVWDNRGTFRLTYDANGGVYAATGKASVTLDLTKYHIYDNCLPSMDYFTREGYQLIEYNTAPDGSGDAYSPGSKIVADAEATLWCIWAKEADAADFTTAPAPGGVAVTSYTGDETTLVIPEKIGGEPVVRIRRGAIRAPGAATIVIPKTVQYVESAALETTAALTTLYIHDSIISIPDDAVTNTKGLSNIRLNAARAPGFTDQMEGSFAKKWERLVSLKEAGKKVLVLVSGSSSFYGLDSALLEELIGGEYAVVNYGTNAATPIALYLDVVSNYVTEGDLVVYAPEISNNCTGNTAITWKLLRGTEYYYNVWRELDMRNYTNFFSSLTEFNTYRLGSELDYTPSSDLINDYGDRVNVWEYNPDNYHGGSNINPRVNYFSGARLKTLERIFSQIRDSGSALYMSCAPCNANAFKPENRTDEKLDAYMESMKKNVSATVISHLKDYMLEGKMMYNSDYHPNAYGRDLRTRQLAKDILAQWAKEGK